MKNILLILLGIILVISHQSCTTPIQKEVGDIDTSQSDVIIDDTARYLTLIVNDSLTPPEWKEHESKFEVDSARVIDTVCYLYINYAGGCGSHKFRAYSHGRLVKTFPPLMPIWIYHETDDSCKALVHDFLRINLRNFTSYDTSGKINLLY